MLGEQIRYYRIKQKWSQAELAARLHISASAIGMYEQNRRTPCLQVIIAMARIFQITVDEFVDTSILSNKKEQPVNNCIEPTKLKQMHLTTV